MSTNVFGQPPKPAAAPTVPAGYPTLTTPANLGGAPGSPFELALTGINLTNVTAVGLTCRGTATIMEPSKDGKSLKVKFSIPNGTPAGLYAVRVATEAGVSNARPFLVDSLPTVLEKEGNNNKETPQDIAVPCAVAGAADAEAGDFYRFKVTKGQTLTLESLGRRIGSPIDPVLVLRDEAGAPVPGVWADDTPGLQGDARLVHTFKSAGVYIVEIRDSTYRGGAEYAYRLRIGEFPAATCAFPLAVERGKAGPVGFAGQGVEASAKQPITLDAISGGAFAAPVGKGGLPGWPVPVRVSEHPEAVEQEPNDTPAQANALPVPGGVSARFETKNDIDHFKFAGKKGKKVVVQALSYELGLPTEVFVRLLDAKGGEMMKSSPQGAARLEYTPAADGDVFIACEQGNYAHGPNEIYHLSVTPVVGDFAVTLGLDRADAPAGGVGSFPVVGVTRFNGFAGPIELEFHGSKLTITPGAAPTPAAPIRFPFTVPKDAKPGILIGAVKATAGIDGAEVVRYATAPDIAKAALAGLPVVPVEWQRGVAVAVTPAAPFTLELVLATTQAAPGTTIKATIKTTRTKDFDGEIVLASVGRPGPGSVTAKLKPIPKGKSEVDAVFLLPADAPPGPSPVLVRGTAMVKGKDVVVSAPVVDLIAKEKAKR